MVGVLVIILFDFDHHGYDNGRRRVFLVARQVALEHSKQEDVIGGQGVGSSHRIDSLFQRRMVRE